MIPQKECDFISPPVLMMKSMVSSVCWLRNKILESSVRDISGIIFPENNGSIMSAESERIAQRIADCSFLSLIKSEIQLRIKFRIIGKVIDGRRNDIVFYSHDRSHGFDCA